MESSFFKLFNPLARSHKYLSLSSSMSQSRESTLRCRWWGLALEGHHVPIHPKARLIPSVPSKFAFCQDRLVSDGLVSDGLVSKQICHFTVDLLSSDQSKRQECL